MRVLLFEIYKKLTALERPKEGIFLAEKTPFLWLRVAIDHRGHPLFFIEPEIGEELPPALPASENFELKFRNSGIVKTPSGDSYEMVDTSIISFLSLDQELVNLFFEIFEVFLSNMPVAPSEYEISQRCANYLEMFKLAKSPTLRVSLGLWGELFFILQHENIDQACEAWHLKPSENYDFVFTDIFHEIKTTKQQKRKHTLKLSQIEKSGGRGGFITSIMTRESAEGLSCLELARQILQKVERQSSSDKILKVISQLGYAEENMDGQSFCIETAKATIAHFDVTGLPRPDTQGITEISNVEFDLNFENLPSSDC